MGKKLIGIVAVAALMLLCLIIGVGIGAGDDEVLSNADFITSAEEQHEKELERLRNLHHARTQDCGLVIV